MVLPSKTMFLNTIANIIIITIIIITTTTIINDDSGQPSYRSYVFLWSYVWPPTTTGAAGSRLGAAARAKLGRCDH